MAKNETATATPAMEFTDGAEFPTSTKTSKYDPLVEQLKANPGQVGKLGPLDVDGSSIAQTLKKRGIEAVTRTIDGQNFVFARYVADES